MSGRQGTGKAAAVSFAPSLGCDHGGQGFIAHRWVKTPTQMARELLPMRLSPAGEYPR